MKPTEEAYFDKSTWGDGPWQSEPDRIEWRFSGTPRLAMLIVRNSMGALCGYVGVPPGHPWHGKQYGEVDADVHGGLTYSDACVEGGKICHVALPGEPEEVWWQGFDCGHSFDLAPGMNARLKTCGGGLGFLSDLSDGTNYRDVGYVRAEVERLALQASRVAKGLSPSEEG
jgi:hypothetical protein